MSKRLDWRNVNIHYVTTALCKSECTQKEYAPHTHALTHTHSLFLVHKYTCMQACTHVCMCVRTHTNTNVHRKNMHHIHTHTNTLFLSCTQIHTDTCTHTHRYMHTHTHRYMHTHTHTHTHTQPSLPLLLVLHIFFNLANNKTSTYLDKISLTEQSFLRVSMYMHTSSHNL